MNKKKPEFDPELRTMARLLPRGVGSERALRVIRPLERLVDRRPPPPGITVEHAGSVPIRVQRPEGEADAPHPAVLWLHGGGYVLGKAAQDDKNCDELCRKLGVVAAAVDYRTAPEHPFPAALDDAHDALVWLAAQPEVDAKRIAIAGASAGGGLAAALALEARERGEVDVA
ncbi:MAG: alpha/beta hydrolase, partial [Microthrixaceae bacterium]